MMNENDGNYPILDPQFSKNPKIDDYGSKRSSP
jgi:hypothetical protein